MTARGQVDVGELEEMEVLQIGERCIGAVDLAEWMPRIHFIDASAEDVRNDLVGVLDRLGVKTGRPRELMVREMRSLRVQSSQGAVTRWLPRSVVVDADVLASAKACNVVSALSRAGTRTDAVVLRSETPIDPDDFRAAVRALYDAGIYRIGVVLNDHDVEDRTVRTQVLSLLQDRLWSVVPELRVSWKRANAFIVDDPAWVEVAARLWLSEYAAELPKRVWARIRSAGIEVAGFEIPSTLDERAGAVRWLEQSYEKSLVERVSTCWPYSTVAASLRDARLISPACVRLAARQLRIDARGGMTCCPRYPATETWETAIQTDRYWPCAMERIAEGAHGCCNAGRLIHRECVGGIKETCRTAACDAARGVFPVLLRGLWESLLADARERTEAD